MAKSLKEKRKIKHLRVRAKISGTPEIPRLNVYKSNTGIYAQIIDDINGVTLASASTQTLKLANANIDAAIKIGSEIAKQAKDKKIEKIVFDRGGYIYHGKVKALADEVRKAGIKF